MHHPKGPSAPKNDSVKTSPQEDGKGCEPCPFGWYQNQLGEDRCLECDPGRFANETNATSCEECANGKFASEKNSSVCVWPQFGHVSGQRKVSEELIPPGYGITRHRTEMEPCPKGTYGPKWPRTTDPKNNGADTDQIRELRKVWDVPKKLEQFLANDECVSSLCLCHVHCTPFVA